MTLTRIFGIAGSKHMGRRFSGLPRILLASGRKQNVVPCGQISKLGFGLGFFFLRMSFYIGDKGTLNPKNPNPKN